MAIQKRKLLKLALVAAIMSPMVFQATARAEVYEIDSLKNLYQGVQFDHDMHVEITGEDCSVCHHHTAGIATKDPLCKTCHRESTEVDDPSCDSCHVKENFSAENMKKSWDTPLLHHRNKPGLKAAYHRNCLACHEENEAPVGCTDCHEMTAEGEKYYRAGQYAPAPKANKEHGVHH